MGLLEFLVIFVSQSIENGYEGLLIFVLFSHAATEV